MDLNRRKMVQLTGLVAAGGLAGCAEGEQGDDGMDDGMETTENTPIETETPTETETATPTETETQTPTETPTPTPEPIDGVELVLDNVGISAWELTSDESGSVGPTGEENPTLTFEVGTRYVVENDGWDSHPFALRDADDNSLLSQSSRGSYEDDPDVDWVDEGARLAFTVTDALAADVDYYICTFHSSMRGTVQTE